MDHKDVLEKLCRVCGRQVVTKAMKAKHTCADYQEQLMAVFQVSIVKDYPETHPRFFCHSCKIVLHKVSSRHTQYQHKTVAFKGWCTHVEGSCTV